MHLDYPMKKNGMYIIKKREFDDIGEEILSEYMPDVLEYPKAVDIMNLATECLYLDVKDMYITQDGSILGMIAFDDIEFTGYDIGFDEETVKLSAGTVLIDYSLWGNSNIGRRRYTLAHECSHWICHRPYHSPDKRTFEFRKNEARSLIACRSENIEGVRSASAYSNYDDSDWEEWQADSLAAAILMPRKTFARAFSYAMYEEGVRLRYLIKGDDIKTERRVIHRLTEIFEVSHKAAEIRLRTLGLLRECSYDGRYDYVVWR